MCNSKIRDQNIVYAFDGCNDTVCGNCTDAIKNNPWEGWLTFEVKRLLQTIGATQLISHYLVSSIADSLLVDPENQLGGQAAR